MARQQTLRQMYRGLFIILVLAIVVSTGLYISLNRKLVKTHQQQIDSKNQELSYLQNQTDRLQQQLKIDSLIFHGQANEAEQAFQALLDQFGKVGSNSPIDSSWYVPRKSFVDENETVLQELSSTRNKSMALAAQNELLLGSKQLAESRNNALRIRISQFNELVDSLKNDALLKELRLNQAKAEVTVLQSQPQIAYLEFSSANKNLVRYFGEITTDSVASGFGVGVTKNSFYKGEWRNNEKHGVGEQYDFYSSQKYVGDYKNNKRCGQGKLIDKDGNTYVGGFKDGFRDGPGKIYLPDGSLYIQGFWEIDRYKRNKSAARSDSASQDTTRKDPTDLETRP